MDKSTDRNKEKQQPKEVKSKTNSDKISKDKVQDSKTNDITTLQLIEDLMIEIQKFSEELAFYFPER